MSWARVTLIGACMITGAASAQTCGQLQDLGRIDGRAPQPLKISKDGNVILANHHDSNGIQRWYLWKQERGWLQIVIPDREFEVTDISADGRIVVGFSLEPGVGIPLPFYYTEEAGPQHIGSLAGLGDYAHAVSGDGSTIVGTGYVPIGDGQVEGRVFRWTWDEGMESLGAAAGFLGWSLGDVGVSFDGSVIAAQAAIDTTGQIRVMRWTQGSGWTVLGPVNPAGYSWLGKVSADGSTIVGVTAPNAAEPLASSFRWTSATQLDFIGPLNGRENRKMSVSADGTVVAGQYSGADNIVRGFRWKSGQGWVDLGVIPGFTNTYVEDMSADGEVVVGWVREVLTRRAFRWTPAGGMIDLGSLGGSRTFATGVSADGLRIVGSSQRANQEFRGFLIDNRCDTDGDGLLDEWEQFGIPYFTTDGDLDRYLLPGADPMRKDLYLEIDADQGASLEPGALTQVINAFAQAPLTNPDGSTGVTLHIEADDSTLLLPFPTPVDQDGWPTEHDAYRSAWFGTAADRASPDREARLDARAKAYRYCIVATSHTPLPENEIIPGIAAVGYDWLYLYWAHIQPMTGTDDLATSQAAVLMHELGHCLGLEHGGCDDRQGKPNQPSIMNYTFSYPYEWNRAFWRLDYLRVGPEELGTLNENALNEQAGIGIPNGEYSHMSMPYGVDYEIELPFFGRRVAFARLNGSPIDFGSPGLLSEQDGEFDLSVEQDLNYLLEATDAPEGVVLPRQESPGEPLSICNEWQRIVLPTLEVRSPRGSRGTPEFPDEPSLADIQWIDENLPPPPAPCLADVNGDGQLDFFDLQVYLNWYAAGDDRADFIDDDLLDFFDVQLYLNLYAAGCP